MDDAGGGEVGQIEQELQHAISDVLSRHSLLPTKWIAAIELIDAATGERVLEAYASPDFRAWDSIGMIGFLDARERGAVGADAAGGE